MKEYSLLEMMEGLQNRTWTSVDLVDMYLDRIYDIDQKGPALNAIAEINPDVYEIAHEMDRIRETHGPNTMMHGIPVVIKDNINTHDKMHTTANSLALADLYAPYEATLVKKLRDAGIIILGKANLSEFAYFMGDEKMPSGYGSRNGQVKSPYHDDLDPLGSSTGSAVAVAANMIPVSIGTETNGSLTAPAQNNSVVAIKPTLGMVSRTGIIPVSHLQDTAGPMARTVIDAAILLQYMYGRDKSDLMTYQTPKKNYNFVSAYKKTVEGKTIGFLRWTNDEYDDEEKAILDEAWETFRNKKAKVKNVYLESKPIPNHQSLIYEFKADLNHYLSTIRGHTSMHSLSDIISFNKKHKEDCLKYNQAIFEAAEKTSGTLIEPEYRKIRKNVVKEAMKMDDLLYDEELDAIVMPRRTSHAPVAGNPIVSVPAKALNDLKPRSLCFVGKRWDDETLINIAYHYETSTKHRIKPKL